MNSAYDPTIGISAYTLPGFAKEYLLYSYQQGNFASSTLAQRCEWAQEIWDISGRRPFRTQKTLPEEFIRMKNGMEDFRRGVRQRDPSLLPFFTSIGKADGKSFSKELTKRYRDQNFPWVQPLLPADPQAKLFGLSRDELLLWVEQFYEAAERGEVATKKNGTPYEHKTNWWHKDRLKNLVLNVHEFTPAQVREYGTASWISNKDEPRRSFWVLDQFLSYLAENIPVTVKDLRHLQQEPFGGIFQTLLRTNLVANPETPEETKASVEAPEDILEDFCDSSLTTAATTRCA